MNTGSNAGDDESGGLEWLRILGQVLSAVPHLYAEYRPEAGDPAGKVFGKNAVRYGSLVVVGGLGSVVCGMTMVRCSKSAPAAGARDRGGAVSRDAQDGSGHRERQ